jgi:benzoyl-CoA reductase/2-hydroxyglutaryl-CoA dehydratase subunit BcrC/BadD/HgdB
MFKHWKANAYLLLINRGCVPMTTSMYDFQRDLNKQGIPTSMFEGNFADCRDIDETGVLDRLETFLEGQGIHKIKE